MTVLRNAMTSKAKPEGESRWIAATAAATAIAIQSKLPEEVSVGPSSFVPIIAGVLLVFLLIANPRRLSHVSRDLRVLSILLIILMNLSNVSSLALLLHSLIRSTSLSGRRLLLAAVEIWFTSVIVYGLWLWELDRGGPLARVRGDKIDPDLLFPQMTDSTLVSRPWQPTFIDYLYVSLTNSTAFSPTDTMPLTTRVKLLMGAQALTSLAVVALVGARAVNILK